MKSSELVRYLDTYLDIARYQDRSNNGLQVQSAPEINHVALAVDACLASFQRAVELGADLLITHHGLFWSEHLQVTGAHYERLRALMDGGCGLYAAHLPLDAHPEVGNNAELARLAGLKDPRPWGDVHGVPIGIIGDLAPPMRVPDLYQRLAGQLGEGNLIQARRSAEVPAHALCSRVAVCSGFGVTLVDEALAAGADTLITGETSHQWYQVVAERDISVLYAGHYASETVGLKALQQHLATRFALRTTFIDLPTGL